MTFVVKRRQAITHCYREPACKSEYKRISENFTLFPRRRHSGCPNRFVEHSKAELPERLANQDQTLWTPLPISASGSLGAVAGMMAAPIVYLDPDMMSDIQENDRTNDSSLVTFQAPLHQCIKAIL